MLGVKQILPGSIQYAGDSVAGPADGEHLVATKNRWSRVVLNFTDLVPNVWYEFSFQIGFHQAEEALSAYDIASVGVDFLTEDGSSIDFPYLPGLVRAQIDPYNEFVAGPMHGGGNSIPARQVHCNFLIPAPARQLAISIRGWRNSHPLRIESAVLRQFSSTWARDGIQTDPLPASAQAEIDATSQVRRNWKALSTHPQWYSYCVVPGHPLFVRGQVIAEQADKDGALARVVFRDAQGQELPPPYPETLMASATGAFINIPTHMQARRFTLELVPPPGAATVDLGFQSWRSDVPMELVAPLEISLDNSLLLENIIGDETQDAVGFLTSLLQKMDLFRTIPGKGPAGLLDYLFDDNALSSAPNIHRSLVGIQHGERNQQASGQLRLGTFPEWPLPDTPTWAEDPFRSPAWRLEFHSLSWLPSMARGAPPNDILYAIDLALSWSRANFQDQIADTLSAHPFATALRAEALIELLSVATGSKDTADSERRLELTGEIVRHGFILSEIIGQNIFSHSIHQVHAASSLLALALSLPRLPLADYWRTLALDRLRESFNELIDQDGVFFEKSQHNRLTLLSLGLILSQALSNVPEAYDFRQDLAPRLKKAALTLITLTDPAGMLPPFGEMAHGCHHASWLRRLISQFGQTWMKDKSIRSELEYPQGSRNFAPNRTGVLAARHYRPERDWGYFGSVVSEQRQPYEHWDNTSFVYSAGGVRWITDPGGSSQYETSPMRQYLAASRAHNVALPDGREQTAGTSWLHSTISIGDVDIHEIRSNVHGPDYDHRRIFAITKELGAIAVFDAFKTSQRLFVVEGHLHFEPDVMAAIANSQLVMAFRGQKRLRVVPYIFTGRLGGLELVQGLNMPASALQGFVSRKSGLLEPASVLRYKLVGQESICGGVVMTIDRQSFGAVTQALKDPAVQRMLT